MGRRRGRAWGKPLAAAVALTVGSAACGGDDGGSAAGSTNPSSIGDAEAAPAESPPYPVETVSETFEDESRPTDDPEAGRSAESRTLETDLYVPDGEGPFPLIVHAHGFDGNAGKYSRLLTGWAERGYVVAAPTFPLTNDLTDAPSVGADVDNQPADVTFVIDQVLALAEGDHELLAGRVDGERIGVSGHSLGGVTTYRLLYNSCCRDDRVDAHIVLASFPLPPDGGTWDFSTGPPMLLYLSDEDYAVPYSASVDAYENVGTNPKYLVSMEGNEHFEPFEDAESSYDDMVEESSGVFWDAYLGGAADGAEADGSTGDPVGDELAEIVSGHDQATFTAG